MRVAYYESEKRGLSIVLDGGTLTVTSDGAGASLGVLPEVSYRTVKVYLPAGLASISLTTTGESVALSDISAGEVALDVNGGDVSFERLAVGVSLGVTVKNGNIAGSLLGGWDDLPSPVPSRRGRAICPNARRAARSHSPSTATTVTWTSNCCPNEMQQKRSRPRREVSRRGAAALCGAA